MGLQDFFVVTELMFIRGIGTITKDKNVLVNGSELLETKKIILAGGSKVSKINVPGMESSPCYD